MRIAFVISIVAARLIFLLLLLTSFAWLVAAAVGTPTPFIEQAMFDLFVWLGISGAVVLATLPYAVSSRR